MSAAIGSPGSSCRPVKVPVNQNGSERTKTNDKNLRGDLFRNLVFEESTDCWGGCTGDTLNSGAIFDLISRGFRD